MVRRYEYHLKFSKKGRRKKYISVIEDSGSSNRGETKTESKGRTPLQNLLVVESVRGQNHYLLGWDTWSTSGNRNGAIGKT